MFLKLTENETNKFYIVDTSETEPLELISFDGVYTIWINTNDVTNINTPLFSNKENIIFISEKMSVLIETKTTCFILNEDDTWAFQISLEDYKTFRIRNTKLELNKSIINKFPLWKQNTLKNDRDNSIIELSLLCSKSTSEIERFIINIPPFVQLLDQNMMYNIGNIENDYVNTCNEMLFNFINSFLNITVGYNKDIIYDIIRYYVFYGAVLNARKMLNRIEPEINALQTLTDVYEYKMTYYPVPSQAPVEP